MKGVRKLGQYNQITVLWILSQIERRNNHKYPQYKKRLNNLANKDKRNRILKNKDMYQDITPPQSNISSKKEISKRVNSTLAFNVEHEIHSRSNLPATDIEKGWIIHSGASAHMTPFKRDCKDIVNTYRKIFLADGSSVYCQTNGKDRYPH